MFGAFAATVTMSGLGILVTFGKFMGGFYISLIMLWLVIFTACFLVVGPRAGHLAHLVREPLLLAFSTASSEAAYPKTLERLERAKTLMQPATGREFGIAASEAIRNYIEKRFEVIATQRTTEEFLQTLLQSPNETLARHRSRLGQFLQQCDFVKFAGASLTVTDMEALFQSARGFVLETGQPSVA